MELVEQELEDWSILLLGQVGLVKLLKGVEFFKLSPGAGGVAQIVCGCGQDWSNSQWERAGLVKLSVGAGRIGQNSFASGQDWSDFLWE